MLAVLVITTIGALWTSVAALRGDSISPMVFRASWVRAAAYMFALFGLFNTANIAVGNFQKGFYTMQNPSGPLGRRDFFVHYFGVGSWFNDSYHSKRNLNLWIIGSVMHTSQLLF